MPERSCDTCSAEQKKIWGCNAVELPDGTWEEPALESVLLNGKESFRCPRRPIKDDPAYWSELFTLYRGYKNGFLPDEGAIASQSARGWKLLSLLDSLINRAEGERMEKGRSR